MHNQRENLIKPIHVWFWKIDKRSLKILQCSHRKIFMIRYAIFQHYTWTINKIINMHMRDTQVVVVQA